MPVFPPHGPVHEETEFWYDTKEKALLYEVNTVKNNHKIEADHQRTRDRGHLWDHHRNYHRHYQPHGIFLLDKVIGESRRKTSLSNIELLVRLWLQIEKNDQPLISPYDDRPILPVTKPLALYLAEKQAELYKDESITQGLILLQTYLTAQTAR